MRHTVIGLFDTYAQAEAARDTLVQTGFARETIELQANPEPSVGSATDEVAGSGVLANIERFLSSLFASGPRAPETARYAEAVRRGAVLVCVNAASESHAELARNTLTRLGATDIGERSPDWDVQPERRDHSVLDELGIGAVTPGTPHTSSVRRRSRWRCGYNHATCRPGRSALYGLSGHRRRAVRPAAAHRTADRSGQRAGERSAGRRRGPQLDCGWLVPGSGAVMQPSEIVSGGSADRRPRRTDAERVP